MTEMKRCLSTFDVTSAALMFERLCRGAGFDVRLVPVPRSISASCGLACQWPCERAEEIKALAAEKKIDVTAWHELDE